MSVSAAKSDAGTSLNETVPWQNYRFNLSLPVFSTIDIFATIIAVAAALALFQFKVGVIRTLLACSLVGVVLQLAFGSAL